MVAIFWLALLPRLGALERYVTPDELKWTERSIRFSAALARGDGAATLQAGHPGVMTMWLGSIGLLAQRTLDPSITPALDTLARSAPLDPQDPLAIRAIAPFLTAARWPVILVVSINLALLFALLARLIDRRAAFLAAALVALDPFNVALGSLLHVDALLVSFSLLSLTALKIALERSSARGLIASGAWAGLALLSKSPAVALSVVAAILVVAATLRTRAPVSRVIQSGVVWGLSALIVFSALYPAMWIAPVAVVNSLADTAQKFSETAHAVNFFNGSNERDPGPLFYPAALAFRSTPIVWLGLIAAIVLIVRAKSEHARRLRSMAWIYGVFALVFLGVIALGAKKLDRYALPALEALNVTGAIGLAFVIARLSHSRKSIGPLLIVTSLVVTALPILTTWPYALRAYNPLLGGYVGASAVLPVGGGENSEVGRALAASPYAASVIAATDLVGTAPFFAGALVAANPAGFTQADDLLFTSADFQLTPDFVQRWIGDAAPVLTVTAQNQALAWLYPNQWLAADRQRLIDDRQPGDAVIVDYPMALPELTRVVSDDLTDAAALEMLQQLAIDHHRVFVYHAAASPRHATSALFRLLDTYAINLAQWASPLSDGALYALPDQLTFSSQPRPLRSGALFDDRVQLTDAEVIQSTVQPGQTIGLISAWAATGAEAQFTVALIDAGGHEWSTGAGAVPLLQEDQAPRSRRIGVPAPLTIPPGDYRLMMNVIDLQSGRPLQTRRSDGALGGIDWPLGTIAIAPAQTRIDPATRQPPIALNVDLGGTIRAIGSDEPPYPVISGDPWTLSMEWAALTDQLPALDVQWNFVAAPGSTAYSTTLPLNAYSTDRWRAGDVLQSKYDFRLPITLASGRYSLEFQVIDHATHQPFTPRSTRLTPIEIGPRPRAFTAPPLAYPTNYRFDHLTTLIGANSDRAEDTVTVTVYWRAQTITATNYTVFVQLVRPDGQVAGQIDRWQIGGDAPTNTWARDQIIADAYPFDVPSGEYQVWVGMYNAADGQRLPAYDAQGQRMPEDKALVLTLR